MTEPTVLGSMQVGQGWRELEMRGLRGAAWLIPCGSGDVCGSDFLRLESKEENCGSESEPYRLVEGGSMISVMI